MSRFLSFRSGAARALTLWVAAATAFVLGNVLFGIEGSPPHDDDPRVERAAAASYSSGGSSGGTARSSPRSSSFSFGK